MSKQNISIDAIKQITRIEFQLVEFTDGRKVVVIPEGWWAKNMFLAGQDRFFLEPTSSKARQKVENDK
ncbi:MAG: hypothetical protein KDH96_10450 [Candidatus Riesia sp.]|nr:hypothetical protein [Candidatus Riesia sp.]